MKSPGLGNPRKVKLRRGQIFHGTAVDSAEEPQGELDWNEGAKGEAR